MSPPDSQRQPLDAQVLASLRDLGGESLVSQVLQVYLASSRLLVEQAQAASATADLEGVRRAAHALKSSSGNVGALALAALCQRTENLSRDNPPAALADTIAALADEYARVRAALERQLRAASAA